MTVVALPGMDPRMAEAMAGQAAAAQARETAAFEATAEERATVLQLAELERVLADRIAEAAVELADLDRARGAAVVDAALSGDRDKAQALAGRLAKLREEVAGVEEAIAEARTRREAGIRAVFAARAAAIRAGVAPLQAQLEERETRTAALKAALKAYTGVDWIGADELPAESVATDKAVLVPTQVVRVRPEVGLRDQIRQLEWEAKMAEGQQVRRNGVVEAAASAEELVTCVIGDGLTLGPSVLEVRRWAMAAEAQEHARRAERARTGGAAAVGYIPEDAPLRFRLCWNNSQIDLRESGVLSEARDPRVVDEEATAERLADQRARERVKAANWLKRKGGNLKSAIERARSEGPREAAEAESWAKVLEDEALVDPAGRLVEDDSLPAVAATSPAPRRGRGAVGATQNSSSHDVEKAAV